MSEKIIEVSEKIEIHPAAKGGWVVINVETGGGFGSFSDLGDAKKHAAEIVKAEKKPFEARMYGIGYSRHSTEAAAKRAIAGFRRDVRNANPGFSGQYPQTQICLNGKPI